MSTTARPPSRRGAICARAGATAAGLMVAAASSLALGGGRSVGWLAVTSAVLAAFTAIGAVLCSRVQANPIGWLFLGGGVVVAAACLLQAYSTTALADGRPGGLETAVAVHVIYGPLIAAVLAAMLLLFPDGRLPSPRWRPVAIAEAGTFAVFTVTQAMGSASLNQLDPTRNVPNPLALSGGAATAVNGASAAGLAILFVLIAASAVSLVRRFRTATGELRQQLKWFGGAAVMLTVAYASGAVLWNVSGEWAVLAWVGLFAVATGVLPVATGIAILRYRLYEIDVIVRKTLIYAALVASLAVLYLAGVAGLGAIFRAVTGQSGALAVTLSTLTVAAAFQPLRRRIQRSVDRRFYRGSYDAAAALDALAVRLRSQVDLEALDADVLAVVRSTVQPSHATLWIRR